MTDTSTPPEESSADQASGPTTRQASTPTPPAQDIHASTNSMALVGFALSVLGCLLAPAALGGVVCGHIARSQIRKSGEAGDSWALAGLVLGYLLIVLSLAGLLIFGGMMMTMFGIMAFSS